MWLDFSDLDRTFFALDDLKRRVDRAFSDLEGDGAYRTWRTSTRAPGDLGYRFRLEDDGAQYVLWAEVPGAAKDAFDLQLTGQVLTVSGARQATVPPGASTHRQERPSFRFTRSFTLPSKVDAEKVAAHYQDGVLKVTLEKAKEAQPRRITVKAG